MEVEVNNTHPFLDVLVMKRGPNLATKGYRKPIHTGRYLHFKSNHPHHSKRGVPKSLVIRAKVMCQDPKDFSKEIKYIRHDPILNKYPQEFVDSVIKPGRSNRPSLDTRRIGNRINVRTIFKTKHTLRGTLVKTGPVRNASRRSSMCIVFRVNVADVTSVSQADPWKFASRRTNTIWPKVSSKNQSSTNMDHRKATKYVEKSEGPADWAKRHLQEIQGIRPHVSGSLSDQLTQLGHLPIWTAIIEAEVKEVQPRPV
jgi:hypothetical protein